MVVVQVHHKDSKNSYPPRVKVLFFLYTEESTSEPEGYGVTDTEHYFKFLFFSFANIVANMICTAPLRVQLQGSVLSQRDTYRRR